MRCLRPILALLLACGGGSAEAPEGDAPATDAPPPQTPPEGEPDTRPRADAVSVDVSGSPGAYTFSVGIRSDETGCERYADWWEVLRPDGALVYRRILGHSHVDEQPFIRSGGPIPVRADDEVLVRAHLRPNGVEAPGVYRGAALRGTASGGFEATELEPGFASELETAAPQPGSCAF